MILQNEGKYYISFKPMLFCGSDTSRYFVILLYFNCLRSLAQGEVVKCDVEKSQYIYLYFSVIDRLNSVYNVYISEDAKNISSVAIKSRHFKFSVAKLKERSLLATWRPTSVSPEYV